MSYPEHSLGGGSYPSAEIQTVYSTAPDIGAYVINLGYQYIRGKLPARVYGVAYKYL